MAFLPPSTLDEGFRRLLEEPADTPRFEAFEKATLDALERDLVPIAAGERGGSARRKLETVAWLVSFLRKQPDARYRRGILVDVVSRAVLGRPCNKLWVETHSFEPDEMMEFLQELGFRGLATSWEGTLAIAAETEPAIVAPIYRLDQGVFEIVASREAQGGAGQ